MGIWKLDMLNYIRKGISGLDGKLVVVSYLLDINGGFAQDLILIDWQIISDQWINFIVRHLRY